MAGWDRRVGDGDRTAPLSLSLTAALSVALILAMMPTVCTAGQRPAVVSNASMSSCLDGDGEDGGCLAIAEAQPELEGFEVTTDLGSGVVFHRALLSYNVQGTANTNDPNKAGCGREGPNRRYYSCTTDPNRGPIGSQKCSATTRDNPCH